ncbi:MAG: hypothetical protein II121_00335, partial [Fibrobacter sp.]|nr:hypothetical protein [Fibrobacter sp.]
AHSKPAPSGSAQPKPAQKPSQKPVQGNPAPSNNAPAQGNVPRHRRRNRPGSRARRRMREAGASN